MNNNSYSQIYKTLPALLILFAFYIAIMPENINGFGAHPVASKAAAQDDFDKKFREARDLIDKEEWARAAEKFDQVVNQYPKNKSTDAALYWLAFTYKKQKKYEQANAALDRLIKEFPASSWVNDARVMKVETFSTPGQTLFPATGASTANGYFYKTTPSLEVAQLENTLRSTQSVYDQNRILLGQAHSSAALPAPLDREDEIKIAAFQSLLAADSKRAIEVMGEILTADSKASESFKLEALRVLRTPRASGTNVLVWNRIGNQFAPLLRETLIKSFQKEPSVKVRKEIVYALASFNDDQSANHLAQVYASETDKEIKKAIINTFGSNHGGFNLYNGYIQRPAELATSSVSTSGSLSKRKNEFDKLIEIVRTEKDSELRNLAFSNLRRFPNWSAQEGTIDMLAELYDTAPDEAIKINIIRILADTKQAQASKKLFEIAKNDKSDKLKLEAIYSLRSSNNPEVLKFLEDLIK